MTAGICFVVIGFCLVLQAFFCASEMALVASNRLRIRHLVQAGSKRARALQTMLDHPEKFLSTTMVGINVFLVLGATLASFLASRFFHLGDRGPFVATLVMLPLVLIFAAGEGKRFKKDMEYLITSIRKVVPKIFLSEDYKDRHSRLVQEFENRQKKLINEYEEKLTKAGFVMAKHQGGVIMAWVEFPALCWFFKILPHCNPVTRNNIV